MTLPTSRKKRTRLPLAEMSIFSATLEPLKSIVSVPAWPSTVSLPSPGFQTKVSSPAPMKATSLPRPPSMTSLPSPPIRTSSPSLPRIVSLPAPPSTVSWTTPAGRVDALIDVVAAERVDDQLSHWHPPEPLTATRAGRPDDREAGARARDLDVVGTVGAVDDDGVGLAVAGAAARSAGQVEVDLGDVGAGQVVDGDRVGAAQGVEVDPLDAVEVHGDVADVAGEADAAAVGGDVDLLVDVGAVEEHRVGAVLALDGVAAVARVPDEGVVAGAQEGHVVAAAAVDDVVAVAADQACRCRRRR